LRSPAVLPSYDSRSCERHRYAVAAHLGADEAYLWPDALTSDQVANAAESEVISVYPHRWTMPSDFWQDFFSNGEQEIGILVYAGLFLPVTLVVISGFGLVPVNVLWGRAAVRALISLNATYLVAYIGLAALLLPTLGLTGAGWTMIIVASATAGAATYLAYAAIGSRWRASLAGAMKGPVAALALCGAASMTVLRLLPADAWFSVLIASAVGSATAFGWLMALRSSRVPLARLGPTASFVPASGPAPLDVRYRSS
jgi:hypothetical protein